MIAHRQLLLFDGLFDQLFNPLQIGPLVFAAKRDRCPFRASSCCPPDAMHVSLGSLGQVVVDHAGDVGHVQTASRDIGGNQHRRTRRRELFQRLLSCPLRLVAVNGHRVNPCLPQIANHAVDTSFGATKNKIAFAAGRLQESNQHGRLFRFVDESDRLLDFVRSRRFGRGLKCLWVIQPLRRQSTDFWWHGGREHQRLTIVRHMLDDPFQIMNEPHVQHLVGFVQHQHFDVVQFDVSLIHQVQKATGSRDHDIRSGS